MTDLAQQIRDRLDEWARPSGEAPPAFTEPADIDPEQAAALQAAWDALSKADPGPHRIVILPPSPFDLMRRAILAVVGRHKSAPVGAYLGDEPPLICIECSYGRYDEVPWPCPELSGIAEKLGIEVVDV